MFRKKSEKVQNPKKYMFALFFAFLKEHFIKTISTHLV
jgi:hypothetical protein